MRIVTTLNENEHIVGITSALEAGGYNPIYWDKSRKPAFDMFDEIRPDILICESKEIDKATEIAINEYKTKVVLFGMYFNKQITPSLLCYPSDITKANIERIHKSDIPYVQLQKAADAAKYINGTYMEEYASDALYISDSVQNAIQYIDPLHEIAEQHRLRIVGHVKLPMAEYIGQVNLPQLCSLIKSTNIGIDLGGRHLYDYIINKIFCVTTLEQDYMPNIKEFERFAKEPKLRKKFVKEAYQQVKDNHTYFHRTKEVFDQIGYPEIGVKLLEVLGNKVND